MNVSAEIDTRNETDFQNETDSLHLTRTTLRDEERITMATTGGAVAPTPTAIKL